MRNTTLRAFLVFLAIFAVIAVIGWLFAPQWTGGGAGAERIALIYVEGMISGGRGGGSLLGGETPASSVLICDQLYRARDDDSVKAVLLRVNSPGGAAAASDEIYRAVLAVREAGKPVVVSMGDVAASGGYYISAAADYIFANGATLTGSIGVIFNLLNWEEAAAKIGVKDITLTAGEYKDVGSPWRGMTDDERALLTELMTEVHEQFITAVSDGRENMTEDDVRAVATGMVYTGESALEVGLVDGLGGLHAAEDKARELAAVDAGVPVEEYRELSFWDEIMAIRGGRGPGLDWLRGLGADPLAELARMLYLNTTLRDLVMR